MDRADYGVFEWTVIVFVWVAMMYLAGKVGEWLVNLLYDYGYCKWKFSMTKDRKEQAVANLGRAYNLSPKTIGEVRAVRLTGGFTMIILSDAKADEIWKKADEEAKACGTSSTIVH